MPDLRFPLQRTTVTAIFSTEKPAVIFVKAMYISEESLFVCIMLLEKTLDITEYALQI